MFTKTALKCYSQTLVPANVFVFSIHSHFEMAALSSCFFKSYLFIHCMSVRLLVRIIFILKFNEKMFTKIALKCYSQTLVPTCFCIQHTFTFWDGSAVIMFFKSYLFIHCAFNIIYISFLITRYHVPRFISHFSHAIPRQDSNCLKMLSAMINYGLFTINCIYTHTFAG